MSSGQDLRVAYKHRVALTTQSLIEINRQRYIEGLPARIEAVTELSVKELEMGDRKLL